MDSFDEDGELLDFNTIGSLKELGGDDSFFQEIINLYAEQYPELLERIKSSHSAGDLENLSKSAHALKGASLNIGAKKLAEVCLAIEKNSAEGIKEGYDDLILRVEVLYEVSLEELKKL